MFNLWGASVRLASAADVLHRLHARLLAAATRFRADPAVLMLLGVAFAFLSARAASQCAKIKRGTQHGFVRASAA